MEEVLSVSALLYLGHSPPSLDQRVIAFSSFVFFLSYFALTLTLNVITNG